MQIAVKTTLTLNELLASVSNCPDCEGYYTTQEWAAHFAVSNRRMLALLKAAKAAGRLQTSRVERRAVDDSVKLVPVYALTESKQP